MVGVGKIEVDHRRMSLKRADHKELLDRYVGGLIDESEQALDKILPLWNANDSYYEGDQVPPGFSSDALGEFVERNSGLLKRTEDNYLFFVKNKIKDVVNGINGEYLSVKKEIIVKSDDNPRNNKIERAFRLKMKDVEKRDRVWQTARIPAISDMPLRGFGCTFTSWDPHKNFPIGSPKVEYIDARNVMLDVYDRSPGFVNSTCRGHMVEMPYDEAVGFMGRFGVGKEEIRADKQVRDNDPENEDNYHASRDMVTLYVFEYKKRYPTEYEVEESVARKFGVDPKKELIYDDDYYFVCYYNKDVGVFFHQENPYKQWYHNYYYNRRHKKRLYPKTDVEDLRVIQDYINITLSLNLDNARQKNIVRLFVKQKLKDTYGGLLDDFIRYGGTLAVDDDVQMNDAIKEFQIPDLPAGVKEFLMLAEQTFKEESGRYEPLRGELPNNQPMSGVALKQLERQNRKPFIYKDENINYAGNMEATLMYKMIAKECSDQEFIDVSDGKPGDPTYVPINGVMTLAGFEDYLRESGLIEPDKADILEDIREDDHLYFSKKFMILKDVVEEFAKHNEVEYILPGKDEFGSFVSPEGMILDPVDVWTQYSMVFINHLMGENMEVSISLDFDADRSEDADKEIAALLFDKYGDSFLDVFLDAAGGTFAERKDEFIKRVNSQNEMKQLYEQIAERGPEFMRALQELMSRWDKRGSGTKYKV